MMKKYLILMMGLFLVLGSVVFAKPVDDFTYSDGTVVNSGDVKGCSLKMPSNAVPRDYNACIKTVVSDPDRKVYIEDKKGDQYRFQYESDKKSYTIYKGTPILKNGQIVMDEEIIGVANEKGIITTWVYINTKDSEKVSKLVSWKKIKQEDINGLRVEDYKNSKTIDRDGDGIPNIADADIHKNEKDTDHDGVIDSQDEDPENKNIGYKKGSSDPNNQPGDDYDDSSIKHIGCNISPLDCDTRDTCEAKKKCRVVYETNWNNNDPWKREKCPKPMGARQRNRKYNCDKENRENAIQQAEDNNTSLKTQVMNLKEYCESRKGEAGKGLVKYDGVCDETDGATALFQMMDKILEWIRNLIIVIGSALLFWGGVLYIKSAAEPKEKENAKKLMTRVAIGMIFVLFAFAIVQLILDTFADGGVKGKYSGLDTKSKLERSNN